MIDETKRQTYLRKIEAELRENILPFWIEHTVDKEHGGFYGEITNTLDVDENAPRGALLSSRILWTYAAAYKRYRASRGMDAPKYLEMAQWAYDDLLTRHWDAAHGGFFWMIAADGTPLRTRKQIYGQAFAIYALAEYFAATGEQAALDKAIAIFDLIETHSYDPENGGYFEAYTREWQLEEDLRLSDVDKNEKKSMNTHLHVMEAYTNLLRVWDGDRLRRKQTELLDVMMERIISSRTYHTITFFDEFWYPRADEVSYGHDIEASWLLVECAEVLGDAERLEKAQALAVKMAQAVYDEGLGEDGGLDYEASSHGRNTERQWWPQAEAAVGFLNAYQLTGAPHFLEAALGSWDFIEKYLIDREHGGWFRYVTRDHVVGEDDAAKVSFWKCPYHNGRACMELVERLKAI